MPDGVPAAVLHIPHASRIIPADLRSLFSIDEDALGRELLLMTDAFTDELFALDRRDAVSISYPFSRLIVDPERFPDDAQEPMVARGMGVIYTRTASGGVLRPQPAPELRANLVARFYAPHHQRLTAAVDNALAAQHTCLLIDCHSFPSRPLPYELNQDQDRPGICIGTDAYHTPPALTQLATSLFEQAGYTVAVNQPFSGAIVPARHYRSDDRVRAVMVELNRALYMDETTGERLPGFSATAGRVQEVVRRVIRR